VENEGDSNFQYPYDIGINPGILEWMGREKVVESPRNIII